jgi:hypothetical protein
MNCTHKARLLVCDADDAQSYNQNPAQPGEGCDQHPSGIDIALSSDHPTGVNDCN